MNTNSIHANARSGSGGTDPGGRGGGGRDGRAGGRPRRPRRAVAVGARGLGASRRRGNIVRRVRTATGTRPDRDRATATRVPGE